MVVLVAILVVMMNEERMAVVIVMLSFAKNAIVWLVTIRWVVVLMVLLFGDGVIAVICRVQ